MQTKQCVQCSKTFKITDSDQAFYKKINVPEPTHCPECRLQRRLAWRNERNLYQRTCSLMQKPILSMFSMDKPFPVYDIDAWWSDQYNPLEYGCDINWSKPFFEQYYALQKTVPRLALQQQRPMENSQYCNCASRNKNCYLVFSTNQCEDCYHGSWINQSKNCVDNYNLLNCELCYECIDCYDCYHCFYAQDSRNCTDCYFIKNCSGSRNIAFCTNLVNAEHYLFNKSVTEKAYKDFVQQLQNATRTQWFDYYQQYLKLIKQSFTPYFQGAHNEASTGNYIYNCFKSEDCFLVHDGENLRYCAHVNSAKDCMDYCYWGQQAELLYEVQASGYNVTNLKFCNVCWSGCSNLEYCDHCFASKNCFGCVGLKQNQFCILNKQYTQAEYERCVTKLKAHMRETGEYGEFFPVQYSPFAYNETLAQEFFPLSQQHVQQKKWNWKESDQRDYQPQMYVLPERTSEANIDVTKAILACNQCNKNYKIIPQEFGFYQQYNLPLPQICPACRHLERLQRRPKYQLWQRQCMCTQPAHQHAGRCTSQFSTSYAPDGLELIYCETCYQKEIY